MEQNEKEEIVGTKLSFVDSFFRRDASKEEQIELYTLRYNSMNRMAYVLLVLSIVYLVASYIAVGSPYMLVSMFVSVKLSEVFEMNYSSLAETMGQLANILKIILYLSFAWAFRSMVVRIVEISYLMASSVVSAIHMICKLFIILPVIGWVILLCVEVGAWGSLIFVPLAYTAAALVICMPLWPIVWLFQRRSLKKELIKAEKEQQIITEENRVIDVISKYE